MFKKTLFPFTTYLYETSRKNLLLGFALLLLSAFTEGFGLLLLVPLLSVLAQDQITTEKLPTLLQNAVTHSPPAVILLLFFLLLLLRSGAVYWREQHLTKVRLHSTDCLRSQLFMAMLQCRWQQSAEKPHDQLAEQLTAGINRVGIATFSLLKIATTVTLLIVYLIAALHLAPLAMLLSLAIVGVFAYLLRGIHKESLGSGETLSQANRQLYQQVLFYLNGLKSIKAFQRETQQFALFETQQAALSKNQQTYQQKLGKNQFIFSTLTAATLCILAYVGLFWLKLSIVTLGLLVVIFSRLLPMFSDIQTHLQRLLHALPAFADIQQSLDSYQQHADLTTLGVSVSAPTSRIALANASFHYPSGKGIDRVHLTLHVGKLHLLRGPSGCGKTTVADVLSGLLPLQQGEFLFDGQILTVQQVQAWRRHVVYITQEPFLFDASIRDNITWGAQMDDTSLLRICRLAAADFIFELPQALETRIGERGGNLSGGQRQRLLLARALCRKPALLILDEASNALDAETEQQWLTNLQRLHQQQPELTILIISHRDDVSLFVDHTIDLTKEISNDQSSNAII